MSISILYMYQKTLKHDVTAISGGRAGVDIVPVAGGEELISSHGWHSSEFWIQSGVNNTLMFWGFAKLCLS